MMHGSADWQDAGLAFFEKSHARFKTPTRSFSEAARSPDNSTGLARRSSIDSTHSGGPWSGATPTGKTAFAYNGGKWKNEATPTSPSNDTYTFTGKTKFTYNGSAWKDRASPKVKIVTPTRRGSTLRDSAIFLTRGGTGELTPPVTTPISTHNLKERRPWYMKSSMGFSVKNSAWKDVAPMRTGLSGAAGAVFEGLVYVFGGDDGVDYLDSASRYSPATGIWDALPPMHSKRFRATAVAFHGDVHVCGGCSEKSLALDTTETMTPGQHQRIRWGASAPMLQRRSGHVTATLNSSLYICGGHDGEGYLNSAERCAPGMSEWELIPPMKEKRSGASVATTQGKICVCGGHDGKQYLDTIECFVHAIGRWDTMAPMLQRRQCAISAVSGRKLYVFGGHNSHQYLSSCERYDPEKRAWEPVPSMSNRRATAAAAALENGQYVYMIGGHDRDKYLSSIERFDARWEVSMPVV